MPQPSSRAQRLPLETMHLRQPMLASLGFTHTETIVTVPLFFSLAHVHHMFRTDETAPPRPPPAPQPKPHPARPPRGAVLFQMVYTAAFGWYAAYLFLRSGNVVAPIVSHAICNIFQVPPFGEVPRRPDKWLCVALYVGQCLRWGKESKV